MSVKELTQQVERLTEKLKQTEDAAALLSKKNTKLAEQVEWLKRQLFGRKTDRIDSDSLTPDLFDEIEFSQKNETPQDTIVVKTHERKKKRDKSLPPNIPVRIVTLEVPPSEQICRRGHQMVKIGDAITEKLHVKPMEFELEKIIRPQLACKHADCIAAEDGIPEVKSAPLPPAIIPKSIATPSLLAYPLVCKFCDGIPFHRMVYILSRFGLDLTRATLCNWMGHAFQSVTPIIDLMKEYLHKSFLIGMDETPVRVLKEEGKGPGSKCYMWVFRGGTKVSPVIMYHYDPGHGGNVPRQFLGDYKGYIQTDGFKSYLLFDKKIGIISVGCWGHTRRKFSDIAKATGEKPGIAMTMVAKIRRLYDIEAEVRDRDPEAIHKVRQERSVPILSEIKKYLDDVAPSVEPGSSLRIAIDYAAEHWPKLIRYVEDGRIPIDNNFVENAIRPFVIGRKNWLFSDTPGGARASAAFYSLIETAKANGIEPYSYLKYLFEQIPLCKAGEDFMKLLPWTIDRNCVAEWHRQSQKPD